jgi:hypothetical protein
MRLSRDDILKAADITVEEVDVPEWGGTVLVRAMTGQQRDEFELGARMATRGGDYLPAGYNFRAQVIALCCVDDDGKRLFTVADVDTLGEKSAAPLDRIYDVVARLSGMAPGDAESMKENFGSPAAVNGRGAGSSSTSHANSAKPSKGSSPR